MLAITDYRKVVTWYSTLFVTVSS